MVQIFFSTEDNGSVSSANLTGLTPSNINVATTSATIGDGPFGTTTGDFDHYSLLVDAGQVITVRIVANAPLSDIDPTVRIFNSAGTQVAFNDDAIAAATNGLDSFLQFTVATAGVYSVAVQGFGSNQTNALNSGSGNGAGNINFGRGNYEIFINNDSQLDAVTANADAIAGNDTANLLFGAGGADTINGNGGDDVIEGGAGNDALNGGTGNDSFIWRSLIGPTAVTGGLGDGNDVVVGGSGFDNQVVYLDRTQSDNVEIVGSGTSAVVSRSNLTPFTLSISEVEQIELNAAGGDNGVIIGNLSQTALTQVVFRGGEGADFLAGGATTTRLIAFSMDGNDTLVGGAGDDSLFGGMGNDVIIGNAGNDGLSGNEGNDRINAGAGADLVLGGSGDDELGGGADNDVILGEDGNDTLFGEDGDDRMNGGAGNDILVGGLGADELGGGTGLDIIVGNEGNDTIFGEDGNDRVSGGDGNDILVGGLGDDELGGDSGDDILVANEGNDTLFGGAGLDRLNAGSGNDIMIAGDGNDELGGGDDNDTLVGNEGNDTLFGEAGNDTLDGGTGNDVFVLGSGADQVNFGGQSGSDIIVDFNFAEGDRIATFGQSINLSFDPFGNVVLNFSGGGNVVLSNIQNFNQAFIV